MEHKNIPEIRFSGFTNEWEQRKLGDISPLRGGFAFKSSEFRNNGVPIVRISNILSSGEVGGNFAYYDEQDKDDKYILPDKSAILAMSGATTGKVSILSKTNDNKVYQNQRVGYFQPVEGIDYGFISTIVRSELFMQQLDSVLVSGAQPNVSSKEIDSFEFVIPKVFHEQQKIGSFFKQLDNTIALHQRKLDLLKEQKKGFLQKMFPKNSETVPELRFSGFTNEWEERKLSDGTNKIGDGLHGTPKYSEDGEVYFVNGNNLVNGQIVIMPETKRVTSNEQSKDDKALNESTILMSINGTIGNLAWYRGENLMLGKSAAYIEVSDFDKKFIYAYLQTRPVKDYYLNSLTGTTIKNLGLKAIRNTNICTPTIDEQAKIGSFFKKLDDTIALHQRKLELLKEQKKGFLQKMFPKNS
ncbi:restriction endonuclease subunit S [Brochothrix thermosphacta]|uniref:restriction endonuclease subunit S n=1 Tax=Brochothrix thermosphacta TaxID=2756 RepID=UPI00128D4B8A|nr:restriction endonuclease subunit S [Brochothrix thermosphacta]MPQ28912.1 restriction endonuclease subunit S [Brochothrix thermosphacta]